MTNKRHSIFIQEDIHRIANPDISRPFSSLEDAVERLLPYHVFVDPEESSDQAETSAVTAGRRLAWLQTLSQQTVEHRAKLVKLEERLQSIDNRLDGATVSEGRLEEELLLERMLHDQEKELWVQAKNEQQQREAAEQQKRLAAVQAAMASQAAPVTSLAVGSAAATSLLVSGAQLGLAVTPGSVPVLPPTAGIPGSWQQVQPSVSTAPLAASKAASVSSTAPSAGVVGSWSMVQQPAASGSTHPAAPAATVGSSPLGQQQAHAPQTLPGSQPATNLLSGWHEVT